MYRTHAVDRRRDWRPAGAGFFIACLWNYTNLLVTDFITAGFSQLWLMAQTGTVNRPGLLIAVVAPGGHFLLIAACLVGFLRASPARRQWREFVVGGVAAVLYFVAIIVTTGPQYIGLLKRVFCCRSVSPWVAAISTPKGHCCTCVADLPPPAAVLPCQTEGAWKRSRRPLAVHDTPTHGSWLSGTAKRNRRLVPPGEQASRHRRGALEAG